MCPTALLYSDKYFDYCPEQHPYWNLTRFSIVFELVRSLGWLSRDETASLLIHEPQPASQEQLLSYHHPHYISRLQELSKTGQGHASEYGLGYGDNPVFEGVHEASSLIVGGSIELVDIVAQGKAEHGFAFLGGLHHATSAKASGFCYYNDAVLAIKHMLKLGHERILYLDTDAHHGDGTQKAFYDNPNVLTISLHESGRFLFPGTGDVFETGIDEGEGYSINFPFPPFTTDDLWFRAFEAIVPPIWKAFDPDFVYWQCGVDNHYMDPLTRLQLTNNLYKTIAEIVHRLTHETADGRIVLGGGGGYDPVQTAKAWSIVLAEFSGLDLPETVPESWINYCKEKWNEEVKEKEFMNPQILSSQILNEETQKGFNEYVSVTIEEIKKVIFPKHGL
ncbi:MAG: acetoin utilization protein AcuC [Candidatus Hodarchaeales archaeon]|jgi:acetoin utilization protein AcuC